jgi:hypothetical protein
MTEFLGKRKGESKKVRNILNNRANSVPVLSLRQIVTFSRLTGTVVGDSASGQILLLWSRNYLPNKIREFAFKFFNNSLAVNTRISHYVQNRQRGCTLCTVSGKIPVPDETFPHLFYECETACKTQTWFSREYNLPVHERKKIFFTGTFGDADSYNEVLHIMAILIQFFIWEMKIFKRIYSGTTLDIDFRFLLNNCFRNCSRLLAICEKLPIGINNNLRWIED